MQVGIRLLNFVKGPVMVAPSVERGAYDAVRESGKCVQVEAFVRLVH